MGCVRGGLKCDAVIDRLTGAECVLGEFDCVSAASAELRHIEEFDWITGVTAFVIQLNGRG